MNRQFKRILGLVKKTGLTEYSRPRRNGILAINIVEGDELITAALTNGEQDIVLQTRSGMATRFNEREVRAVGRNSQGVRGVTLDGDDLLIGMVAVVRREAHLLVVCENGYGKRTDIEAFRIIHRGGKGVISIRTTERNGNAVTIMEVLDNDELIIVTRNGMLIRLPVQDIRPLGRVTQGVRLINLAEDDLVVDVERVPQGENEEIGELENGEDGIDEDENGAGDDSEMDV